MASTAPIATVQGGHYTLYEARYDPLDLVFNLSQMVQDCLMDKPSVAVLNRTARPRAVQAHNCKPDGVGYSMITVKVWGHSLMHFEDFKTLPHKFRASLFMPRAIQGNARCREQNVRGHQDPALLPHL